MLSKRQKLTLLTGITSAVLLLSGCYYYEYDTGKHGKSGVRYTYTTYPYYGGYYYRSPYYSPYYYPYYRGVSYYPYYGHRHYYGYGRGYYRHGGGGSISVMF